MNRQWIVALICDRSAPPAAEISAALDSALRQLEKRVTGELVVATVPTEATAILTRSVVTDRIAPVHLVAPGENRAAGDPPSPSVQHLIKSATSLSVQPGRGNGQDDWDDCQVWLRSVADILIEIGPSLIDEQDEFKNTCPRIRIDPTDGSLHFSGFPSASPMKDEEFDSIFADLKSGPGTVQDLIGCKSLSSATAEKNAPRARLYASASLLLNLSPSVIFGIGAAFQMAPRWLELWSFATTLAAGIIAYALSRLAAQRAWLSSRALAEICRSLIASRGILDPLFPPSATHLPRFASVARTLALIDSQEQRSDIGKLRDRYVDERIGGQIRYYRDKGREARKQDRWIKRGFYLATALAFFANLAAMLYYMGSLPIISDEVNARWISGFGAWVFPSLAAAAMGFLAIHEASRRSHSYYELEKELEARVPILRKLKSESSITEAVREVENMLLEEVGEWFRGRIF